MIRIATPASLRALYFRAHSIRHLPRRVCAINVSPLLRELILVTVEQGALLSRKPQHRRLAAVLHDQLRLASDTPLQLPLPRDARAQRLAAILRQNPALSLLAGAKSSGASLRTLERLFLEETGMALGSWRRRLRLQLALEDLAAGASVNQAALRCGYNSASAFVSMFRRELGSTPTSYFGLDQSLTKS